MKGAWGLLLVLGLSQMAGDLFALPWLRGLAAATAASPAPKVFTNHGAREPFSTRFALVVHDTRGGVERIELTPELYARLEGPYNRRNALGAVLAAGPILASDPSTRAMFDEVSHYALCGAAPVLRELGVRTAEVQAVDLEYQGRAAPGAFAAHGHERVRVHCDRITP